MFEISVNVNVNVSYDVTDQKFNNFGRWTNGLGTTAAHSCFEKKILTFFQDQPIQKGAKTFATVIFC